MGWACRITPWNCRVLIHEPVTTKTASSSQRIVSKIHVALRHTIAGFNFCFTSNSWV